MPPIDDLPGIMIVPTKDEIREQYLRDVRIRTPGAKTLEGTKEYADASVFSDQASAFYYDAKQLGDYAAAKNKTGAALDEELLLAGLYRLPPAGGSGTVQIGASVGGGTIFAGDEIKDQNTGLRFQCAVTGLYLDGGYVPIVGVDTGPSTNIDAGRSLNWTFPRPGINPVATIVAQFDGTGTTGGRNLETDDEANLRLRTKRANPPASGNDAAYQEAVQKFPTISVQQCFTYAAAMGPGTTGVTFTTRPGLPGASRVPNGTQLASVRAWLKGQFPADDGVYMITINPMPINLVFRASWAEGADNWVDSVPWPIYTGIPAPTSAVVVSASPAPTNTTFRLTSIVGTDTPIAGQSIAFYDQGSAIFRRKRILTVTVINPSFTWDIVVDTGNSVSDLTYTPYVGQAPGPWSDSLDDFVLPLINHFDTFGPGEQRDPLPDPGWRQRRSPRSPASYESSVTNRVVTPIFALTSIDDVTLVYPPIPTVAPVGILGASANMWTMGNIVVYPE